MPKRLTTEEKTKLFIKRSNEKHNSYYGYLKFVYVNSHTKGIITCPICGDFLQSPQIHLFGCGCQNCGKIKGHNSQKLTKEKFVKKSNKKHDNFYSYLKFVYINSQTKGIITCPIHGDFEQSPNGHLSGSGCPKCAGKNKTTEEFIKELKKIFKNKYDFSKVNYKTVLTQVSIICKIHGLFETTPASLLAGSGCPHCGGSIKPTLEKVIENFIKVHGLFYDYSKFVYKNNKTKGIIICPIHGEFLQRPNNHLNGQGCPRCSLENISYGISKPETEWLNSIEQKENIKIIRQYGILLNKKQIYVDGYFKETNTIYEFNGDYFHGNPNRFKQDELNRTNGTTFGQLYENTVKKEQKLKEAGYNVVSIWESDYKASLIDK